MQPLCQTIRKMLRVCQTILTVNWRLSRQRQPKTKARNIRAFILRPTCAIGLAAAHFLPLLAEAVDAQPHHVTCLRNTALGLIPSPTPGGVPVVTTSPGLSVMHWLM